MGKTTNVKLGVCNVRFGGVDLGFTKGGVDLEVSTDTHKTMVDQFGESEIGETITKRSVKATVPLAETTVENMVRIMPGAVLVDNGTKQVVTVSEALVVDATLYTVTIDGVAYSYTTTSTSATAWADGLVAAINLSGAAPLVAANVADDVVLTGRVSGETATFSATGGTISASETTPAVVGAKRVDVQNGIGTDLLQIAKELVLHPISKPTADQSEDFIIPLAATAGGLSFAYKTDDERVYNCEFTGYPNASTKVLFKFGDPAAA